MTPEVAAELVARVRDNEEPRFAYMCFTTQDRLSYHLWVEDLISKLSQYRAIIEAYEARIMEQSN